MVILMIPLIGVMALAVDGFMIMDYGVQQESNAEFAALSGIKEFRKRYIELNDSFTNSRNAAVSKAAQIAGTNTTVGNGNVSNMANGIFDPTYGEIQLGHLLPDNKFIESPDQATFDSRSTLRAAVRVLLKTNDKNSVKARFSKILNFSAFHSQREAICFYNQVSGVYGILQ